MTIYEFQEKYERLQHSMQAAIGFEMENNSNLRNPKHQRVGINTALVEIASIAKLLIDKKVITEDEYFEYLLDGMKREAERCKVSALQYLPPGTNIEFV
jgi:hypothetical protein